MHRHNKPSLQVVIGLDPLEEYYSNQIAQEIEDYQEYCDWLESQFGDNLNREEE